MLKLSTVCLETVVGQLSWEIVHVYGLQHRRLAMWVSTESWLHYSMEHVHLILSCILHANAVHVNSYCKSQGTN